MILFKIAERHHIALSIQECELRVTDDLIHGGVQLVRAYAVLTGYRVQDVLKGRLRVGHVASRCYIQYAIVCEPHLSLLEWMAVLRTYRAVRGETEMDDDVLVLGYELQTVVERLEVHTLIVKALAGESHTVRVCLVHSP